MEHQESNGEIFEKITWKIANFSQLNIGFTIYSEPFVLGGYPWRIYFFRKGSKKDGNLSIFLEAARMKIVIVSKGCSNNVSKGCLSKEWSRDVKFKLVVFNQLDTNRTITKEFNHKFNESAESFGYENFISLAELNDPEKGFIVKDVLIVSAEVFVFKSTHDEPVIGSSPTYVSQAGDMVVEVPRQIPEVELGPMKDSSKDADAELVSAALGRVLYFLKTRKVKDMNEQACKDLQVLWDELKKFKFDLTWLEPHVQSALGLKSYVEKSLHVEKLKDDMVLLKEKLAVAEVNLDGEIDLLKAKGFKELGLDSELGCGSWRS